MEYPPEIMRALNEPEKNQFFLAQSMLMHRNPAGEMDWSVRYAEKYRELHKTSDEFRALVDGDLMQEGVLTRIQELLDAPR